MKFKQTLLILACICFTFFADAQTITNDYYNVKTGVGKGIKFWNSDAYKMHMGNTAEYKYGPVTDFSIKTNMNNNAARGWTWGVSGVAPAVAMNTQGNIQNKGWLRTMGRLLYLGQSQYIYGDNASALHWRGNHSTITQMLFRDKENTVYGRVYGSGDGAYFGLLDGDGNWSYLAAKDNYTAFRINNINRMVIRNNGRVGIGSNNPSSKLAVHSTTSEGGVASLNPNGNSHFPYSDGNSYLSGKQLIFRSNGNTERMRVTTDGKVRIGNVTYGSNNYKLFVETGILTEKVKVAVKNSGDWSDYVFEKDYKLMSLENLEAYVTQNKHLPNVPSAEEMVEDGLDVAKMDAKLLEKIEEAHLYIIELHKEIEKLKTQMNDKQ